MGDRFLWGLAGCSLVGVEVAPLLRGRSPSTIAQRKQWEEGRAQLRELALQTWDGFDNNERGFVRFGLFPQQKINPAMRRAEELGLQQRELASALMELAARNASERF